MMDMGGQSSRFKFDDASIERVWAASLRAVSQLGYAVTHSDSGAHILTFNTGRSMSSFAGQDLSATLSATTGGTMMTLGGSLGKGGNPFGGGQMFAWGEKDRLIAKFAATVQRALPDIPEASQTATGSIADELGKLAALRDSGVLSEAEFAAQKARLLA
jgi:hypothetical protein